MMTYDPVDRCVLLFGGQGGAHEGFQFLNDTWTFAHGRWTQLNPERSPPIVVDGGFVWDAKDGYAVLFAGMTEVIPLVGSPVYQVLNETWTFSHGIWNNITGTTGSTPSARTAPLITYDSTDGTVVMFGGWSGASVPSADTWIFSAGKWARLTTQGGPPARGGGSLVDDPSDNGSLLFGGTVMGGYNTATWIYHNLTWSAHSLRVHPSARDSVLLAYAPSWGEDILLQGGLWGQFYPPAATWSFSNLTWTNLTRTTLRAPNSNFGGELAFDAADNYCVLVSADYTSGGELLPRTWVLGPSLLGGLRVNHSMDVGQTTSLNATPYTFVGNLSFNFTGLPPGCASMNVPVLSCTPTRAGLFWPSARVTDSSGSLILETANLSVEPDPVVSSFAATPSSITVGASTRLSVVAEGGTGVFRYAYSGLPPGCRTFNLSDWTCTPTAAITGAFTVLAAVSDAVGFVATATIILTVNPIPTAVELSVSPSSLDVGQSFTVSATMHAGTAPFAYVYQNLPAGCLSQSAPAITCSADAAGAPLINVSVTDAFGWSVSASAFVEVNPTPRILYASATPFAVDAGVPVLLEVRAGGGTGTLSYDYEGAPLGCAPDNLSSSICKPESAGSYTIHVTVTDRAGVSADTSIDLTVNAPISMGGVGVTRGEIDQGQNVTITTSTSFGTPPVRYVYSGLPPGCPASDQAPTVDCVPTQPGSYVVTVIAADPFEVAVQASVGFLVHPAPSIRSIVSNSIPAEGTWQIELSVVAVGGSAVYSFSYAGLPPGCRSMDIATLYCSSNTSGVYEIGVNLTDSLGGSTAANFTLTVGSSSQGGPILPLTTPTEWAMFSLVSLLLMGSYLLIRRRPGSGDLRG